MENDKYYTPSINELHINFECEFYDTHNWIKHIITQDDFGFILFDGIGTNLREKEITETLNSGYRVKYLDSTDIEELGWKLINTSFDPHIHVWLFEIENRIDGSGEWKWLLQLIYPSSFDYIHENIAIYYVHSRNNKIDENTKFDGTIKNKSELKKLIQQLNII